jgi:hypothetical protein
MAEEPRRRPASEDVPKAGNPASGSKNIITSGIPDF